MSDFVETVDTLRARCRREARSYELADYPAFRDLLEKASRMTPGEAHCVFLDFLRTVAGSLTRGNPRLDKQGASWAARQLVRHAREWRAGESLSVADIPPPVEQPQTEEESCFGHC